MAEREKGHKTKIAKHRYLPRGEAEHLSKKPGMSNIGKYKNVPDKDFAGPKGTFPINTEKRARNALARSHFSSDPSSIRRKVFKKYPSLKEHSEFSAAGHREEKK